MTSTLFLEIDDSGAYRGRSGDLIVSVRPNGQDVDVSALTPEGEVAFEWVARPMDQAMRRLADQEEALRVVTHHAGTDTTITYCGSAQAPVLPPAEVASVVVVLPPFEGPQ